jgi:hypothetical protein
MIVKVSDGSTICQVTFKRGAGTLDEDICKKSDELIWSVLEVNDVNTRQGWVKFNLRLK